VIKIEEGVKRGQQNLTSHSTQIQKNLLQNQKLSELRDWLLPMLMNGQVKVQTKKETPVVPLSEKQHFTPREAKVRRKMLATYIINQSLEDAQFGKTKFEKILHLTEYHILTSIIF